MLRHLQGVTAYVIARGEEPPWDALYAPPDMHHYLQRKTAYVIARGEEPPYGSLYAAGGLYAPPVEPCVTNPPAKKLLGKINIHRHMQEWKFVLF
jgi:hypothetical protein